MTPNDTESAPPNAEPEEPEPAPGWWRRFLDWFTRPPRPADRTDRQAHVRPEKTSAFSTPAQGDAYDFLVSMRWRWTDGHWSTRWLKRPTGPGRAEVWEDITVATRCMLRRYPPNMPAEAEAALNRRLDDMAAEDGRWRARAEVGLDEAVREQQRESWKRVLTQQADQKLAKLEREAGYELLNDYTTLVQRWQDLLADVGIGEKGEKPAPYLGRYLVRLAAEPATAANVVDLLSDRREEKDDELLQAVIGAMTGRDQVNLLETDLAYDSALRRLVEWAGLPLPEPPTEPSPNGAPR
jgi:hypothetical protein